METKDILTLVGIFITLIIGLLNLLSTSHKNRLEIITQNRMDWVNSVRSITGKIISWRYNESLSLLLKNINRLILHLNISNEIDDKIITDLLKMYDSAYKLSFYDNIKSDSAKKLYIDYYSLKQNINTLMRIYLKKEWTRIKAESRSIRFPFCLYWIPFLGFSESWATKSLMKKYKKIKKYEFNPWIEFTTNEIKEISSILSANESNDLCQIPIEFVEASFSKEHLRDALISDRHITVPDGKLAGSTIEPEDSEAFLESIHIPDGKLG